MPPLDTLRTALYGSPPSADHEPERDGVYAAFEELVEVIDEVETLATYGVRWISDNVRVRSTANVAIATALENGDTLNGVTLATGDIVFLGSQTAPAENGLYTVVASGAAARATVANSAALLANIGFMVNEGTVGGGERFTLPLVAADITLGTTALNFARIGKEVSVSDEVVDARGTFAVLDDRLDDFDDRIDVMERTEAAIGRAALVGIDNEVDARLFASNSVDIDFIAGYYRYGFEAVPDDFANLSIYGFLRSSAATAYDSLGNLIPFIAEEPRITDLGLWIEPGRTNKVDCFNANVAEAVGATSVAGITATGLTLTVVDDTAAIAAAGLAQICTSGKAVRVVNTSGSTQFVLFDGTPGNTNAHAVSAFVRTTTPFTGIVLGIDGSVFSTAHSLTTAYQRIDGVITPTASNKKMLLRVANGDTLIFVLQQYEEGAYPTTPIVTLGNPATRNNDFLVFNGLNFQTCTFLIDFAYVNAASSVGVGARTVFAATSDTSSQRIITINTTGGAIHSVIELAGELVGETISSTLAAEDELQRVAVRMAADDFRMALNGELGARDADAEIVPIITTVALGSTTTNDAQGSILIKNFVLVPFELTDNEMIVQTGGTVVTDDGSTWQQVRQEAEFSTRDSARTFMLGNRIHLANGFQIGDIAVNDLWRSADGLNWELVNDTPPYDDWSILTAIGSIIYAIGPDTMWKSEDGGLNWTKIVDPMPWQIPFDNPVIATSGGKLLAIPDTGLSPDANAGVWDFNFGTNTWSKVYVAAWGPRNLPTLVEFNGSLFLYGGVDKTTANIPPEVHYTGQTTLNDVWEGNLTGTVWAEVVANLPSSPRIWPSIIEFNDRLMMMGGYDNLNPVAQNFTDTWESDDGINWTRLETAAQYTERHAAAPYVFNGRLYLAAGKANLIEATKNDIWQFSEGVS